MNAVESQNKTYSRRPAKMILIVDDDELNRELLESLVESLGHDSRSAAGGEEALAMLIAPAPPQADDSSGSLHEPVAETPFDLVLLDAMMPGMNGFEVANRIRADENIGQLPIIMVTALTSREDRLNAVKAGANDFITKPIDRTELHVRMSSLLKMKEAQDAIKRRNRELAEANIQIQRAQETIRSDRERLQRVIETNADAIMILDADGVITAANAAVERIFGLPRQSIIGRAHDDQSWQITSTGGKFFPPQRMPFSLVKSTAEIVYNSEFAVTHPDGHRILLSVNASPLQAEDGSVEGAVLSITDISERLALHGRLAHQAFHDALTNLPNRALFMNRLDHALARTTRGRNRVAVLFIDLDNFKQINDNQGHAVGDQLLVTVAERLQKSMRSGDTAARLGGDEFIVLLDGVSSSEHATVVAERILSQLKEPYLLSGSQLYVTPSIGLVFSDADNSTPDKLVRDADAAMYEAKRSGKGCYRIYREEESEDATVRQTLENELNGAWERKEIVVYYHPKVDLGRREVVGVEALVRWQHPTRGLLVPADFLPLAEETGLIVPLGLWVLREACRQVRLWQHHHPPLRVPAFGTHVAQTEQGAAPQPPLDVNINLSLKQLQDPNFVQSVAQVLSETQLEPHHLVFEISETVMMEQAAPVLGVVQSLKELGVRLAIDDFGTGYSSLAYLKLFPLDFLKIDRKFVAGITGKNDDTVIVTSMIALAHALSLTVVAEGTETAAEAGKLHEMGCDFAQGYYFARPLPAGVISSQLENNTATLESAEPRGEAVSEVVTPLGV
ncbi:MAG TPA: EAL domain-containing protein [Abditibacteriaceae bacterium]